MYKVIIVDDEKLIREGLKTFVRWEELGFVVVGEASNGNDAWDLIKKVKPHIVITDIKMPKCSGIALMEKIKNENIDLKIVVLSGYDEFKYVKAALKVGAVDYLLKPIKINKLNQLLNKIRTDLDNDIKKNTKVDKAYNILKEQFFIKLVNGDFNTANDIFQQLKELNICLQHQCYALAIIQLDNYTAISNKYNKHDIETIKFSIINLMQDICERLGKGYSFNIHNNEIVTIIGLHNKENYSIEDISTEIKNNFDNIFTITTTISFSYTCYDIKNIPDLYKHARENMNLKFLLGEDKVIHPWMRKDMYCKPLSIREQALENQLIVLIQKCDIEEIYKLIDNTFYSLNDRDIVYKYFYVVINAITKFLEEKGIKAEDIADSNLFELQKIATIETLKDIVAHLKDILAKVHKYLIYSDVKNTNKFVKEVKEYINNHYADDISLEVIANKVHVHPMYLSRIFKIETGENFIDYLTRFRIEKAKVLMKDITVKIYEISEMVGYNCPRHFSRIFKRITGVSPKEYRKNII